MSLRSAFLTARGLLILVVTAMIAIDMTARRCRATNDLHVRWPVSKRVSSSRADDEDATLIDRIELAPTQ
jgi:hypothetical protein